MEDSLMILIMAGVFVFGFFTVDLLGRSLDGGGRGRERRSPGGGSRGVRRLQRFFRGMP